MTEKPEFNLDRLIAEASVLAGGIHPCHILGHQWVHIGGRWCGCGDTSPWSCSVPVHECRSCGDCDYGDNDEAEEVIADCALRQDL